MALRLPPGVCAAYLRLAYKPCVIGALARDGDGRNRIGEVTDLL